MREYKTQMEAARKGIVTEELKKVAQKEHLRVEELMPLVAAGKVAICANKNHKCLDPQGVGSMLRTKINVNLGVSRDWKDYDIEMQKVMAAVDMGADAIMDLSSHGDTTGFRRKLTSECPAMIGRVGGKCLLTIHFVESSLMLAFLRDANTSASVIEIINLLDEVLGSKTFNSLFPVILTDNGSEFSNPKEIEKRSTIPCNRTKIFYCDPSAPYQKGACEVNHELIRRILPKGSSFDELTQQDITLMMNHINSYKRKKLNNRSPYETFSFYYGEDVLKRLGCSPVAAENIILKPKLLKK